MNGRLNGPTAGLEVVERTKSPSSARNRIAKPRLPSLQSTIPASLSKLKTGNSELAKTNGWRPIYLSKRFVLLVPFQVYEYNVVRYSTWILSKIFCSYVPGFHSASVTTLAWSITYNASRYVYMHGKRSKNQILCNVLFTIAFETTVVPSASFQRKSVNLLA
jgi:hypothetical protein